MEANFRNCAGCGAEKAMALFSASQLRKGPGVSRCAACVAQNVRSSSCYVGTQEQQHHFQKHEFEFVTPPVPTAEVEILWKIGDLKQLLAQKSNEGSKWQRRSEIAKIWFHESKETAHSTSPLAESIALPAPPRPPPKEIQCFIQLKLELEPDGKTIGDIGCYLHKTGQMEFQALNCLEVVLPDGSIKRTCRDRNWKNFGFWGWADFFPKDFNFDETGLHEIGDGGLILRCKAKISKEGWVPQQPSLNKHHNFEKEQNEMTHSSACLAMFENAEFSDVSLVCQEKQTFKCHKAILATWSPVFKVMFSHSDLAEGQTNEVRIEDIRPSVMKALLKFMYCGHFQCEIGDELDLLAAAQKYSIPSVKRLCEARLVGSLEENPSYVPQVLAFTSLHDDLKCLHHAALQSLHGHRDEVMLSEGWATLCRQSPLVALQVLNEAQQLNFGKNEASCECWRK